MYTFAIVLWSVLIHTCYSQLKACYQAVDEELSGDFPCDPDADVSSCCASGNICSSNLYCVSATNQQDYVGTCTDKTWSSPACPFNLTTASASGKFDPRYDKFNYALNTTQCPDGTLCRFADNWNCCNDCQGVREVHYNYQSSAIMPADETELITFYAAAGYSIPSSIPIATSTPTAPPVLHFAPSMNPSSVSQGAKAIGTNIHPSVAAPSNSRAPSVPDSAPSIISSSLNQGGKLVGMSIAPSVAASPTSTPTAPTVPGSASSTTSPSLGKAAKAGIGIGVTLGVVICGVGAISLHQSIHRQRSCQQNDMQEGLTPHAPALVQGYSMELEGTPAGSGSGMKDFSHMHELYDDNARSLKN